MSEWEEQVIARGLGAVNDWEGQAIGKWQANLMAPEGYVI